MTLERFEALALAFGADIARWPAGEREAALRLVIADRNGAEAVLGRERVLDEALDAAPRLAPSQALLDRIIAAAPGARAAARAWQWLGGAGVGLALAAAAASGVAFGVFAVPVDLGHGLRGADAVEEAGALISDNPDQATG